MFIRRYKDDLAYTLEMNEDEFKVMKKLYDKLLFNHEGVSNYFKITNEEVKIVNQMRNNLIFIK